MTCFDLFAAVGRLLTESQKSKDTPGGVAPKSQGKKKTCEVVVDFRPVYSSQFQVVS